MMKRRKKDSIYERAIRLVEGGVVMVDGVSVRAIKSPIDEKPCDLCEMDSICTKEDGRDMPYVCQECDEITCWSYYLKLVLPRKNKG